MNKDQCSTAIVIQVKASYENQSDEYTGVAFVKGAHERNEFFEKVNKQ